LLAFLAVGLNLLMNWFRGDQSPFDILKCATLDWTIFGIFIVAELILSFIGLSINKKEQALKFKAGRGMVPSDIRY
jgi:hypothetical protein